MKQSLLGDVIQATTDYDNLKLWKRFTNFDCFGIRVPGRTETALGCVMGDGGEQFGLMLFLGDRAADCFRAMLSNEGQPDSDLISELEMASFSMEEFGSLERELQAFYRKAGFHPGFKDRVPNFLIKPRNRNARLPWEGDLRFFLTVTKAVIVADRQKLLKPATLDDPRGVCVIQVGEDDEITVTRERLHLNGKTSEETKPAELDMTGVEVIDGVWLAGSPIIPASLEGDDRSMRVMLIMDDTSQKVIQAMPYFAENPGAAVSAFAQSFHQFEKGRKCVARTVVISSRALYEAVEPALKNAGVECVFSESIPKLQLIEEDLIETLIGSLPQDESDEEEAMPAPDDLAGWKNSDQDLAALFVEEYEFGDRLLTKRAHKRYLNDRDYDKTYQEHEKRGFFMAYVGWGTLDYRPSKNSKTIAEELLKEEELSLAEKALLKARMESHPTIYRVVGSNPAAGTIELEDVLLGGKRTVNDQLLSENITDIGFLTCRVFPAGQFHFLELVGPPMGAMMGMEAVEFLRHSGMEFTREGLKRDAHKFGWLWGWFDDWAERQMSTRLCNMDGDELLFHTASFGVSDWESARKALNNQNDLEWDESENQWVWIQKTGEGAKKMGGPVLMGRIELIGDELILSVNSANRYEEAKKRLLTIPGVTFRNVVTRRTDPGEEMPMDERSAAEEEVEITPEMMSKLKEMMDQRYMQWLDTRIPILGDRTPRQAYKTREGKDQVVILIRTMPDPVGHFQYRIPREAMLADLDRDRRKK